MKSIPFVLILPLRFILALKLSLFVEAFVFYIELLKIVQQLFEYLIVLQCIVAKLLTSRFFPLRFVTASRWFYEFAGILCSFYFTCFLHHFFLFYLFYEGMIQHLGRCDPLRRLPFQAFVDEVNAIRRTVRYNSLQINCRVLRKVNSLFYCLLQTFRPTLWSTKNRCYFIQLIDLRISQEQRLHQIHFGDNASHCKYVHRG